MKQTKNIVQLSEFPHVYAIRDGQTPSMQTACAISRGSATSALAFRGDEA
jgi:hypothetical protein